jgi:alkanesulfonate monooxygenase SsuD/methylene tetrahydromethanopterin reductase-like flavin-dependent oxidoreductase (luciferase family)
MYFGIYTPNFGAETTPLLLADLAAEAEEAGWDGFFLWDHIVYNRRQKLPLYDPWVTLSGIAMRTERIHIGTTVTPIARRRPWKLARETVTLDHLSSGRLILSVGLGDPDEDDYGTFNEPTDRKVRAAMLDEGLEILTGLWSGKPFAYQGDHYQIKKVTFLPTPLQSPRIPIWVGGLWPHKRPFRRAARWDGAFPLNLRGPHTPPADTVKEIRNYIVQHRRSQSPFDMVIMGTTPGNDPKAARRRIASYEGTDLTWWLESLFRWRNSIEGMRQRIRQGPPRFSEQFASS